MNTVAQALPNSTIWGFLLFCQAIWKKMLAILSTEYVILHHEVLLEKESHLSAFTPKMCLDFTTSINNNEEHSIHQLFSRKVSESGKGIEWHRSKQNVHICLTANSLRDCFQPKQDGIFQN